ncbi:TrkH family potassium uptake protein [Pseudodesulfovibrio tunisiensis]|uniref:TrkH family potassium uptake protein n=1 Tax=Pseudodesulfovibrio tunisiensis TaxID=463192 RepID=UPI001FB228B9|nr:potassium transporter TrkG [Pseudodesulfovibrio tunisiensis]
MRTKLLSPYWLPVWFFAGAILGGAALLHMDFSHPGEPLSWMDCLFTATSAMCVTGLIVVDTGSFFSGAGQAVILVLIQLGGLGIMTFTSLILHLLGQRVPLSDRIAVGQSLLHDPSFSLGRFLVRVVLGTLTLEGIGAVCLWLLDPEGFEPYVAIFHSISAFCNAGFSLYADSLMSWKGDPGVNVVIMALIIMGGLGFYVLGECGTLIKGVALHGRKMLRGRAHLLSWHTDVVLKTSLFLIIAGTAAIYFAEFMGGAGAGPGGMLAALFQSVTCRTAGFNTVDISHMTNVSLVFMLMLMLIGGSPGSCAGGIKTTTFRAIWGFIMAQVRGRSQVVVGRHALDRPSQSRALTLMVFAMFLVTAATLVLNITEGGEIPHDLARGVFLEILFEVISAFGTVGLSTGLTPHLTAVGKAVIILLMFVGRLGPIWLLSALHSWQDEPRFRLPEDELPLG